MIKFSVLLPTRDRLRYLKYAIETVRRQNYDNWEIIISDNCSEQDITGYAQSLNEPRITCYRTEKFIPVTDNWNNVLEKSTGDYVIMLGDDDCLMKGYFTTLNQLIEEYSNPDLIHTNAFMYAYPGAIPKYPNGFLQIWSYDIYNSDKPYLLDKKRAIKLVQKTLDFRVGFGWNMQFSLVSRSLINELKKSGPFYQSPYPDYYATNLIFVKTKQILICPYPMVAIGITPKSFGGFYFSDQEQKGIDLLKNMVPKNFQNLQDIVLPGEQHNTSWLFAVETIKRNIGAEYPDLCVNYRRYRFIQIFYLYKRYYMDKQVEKSQILELRELMNWSEKLYSTGLWFIFKMIELLKYNHDAMAVKFQSIIGQYPLHTTKLLLCENNHKNILEVFEKESEKIGGSLSQERS
ncbi:glycosyltransferase family 2 protein [bacterium]|nr:glycosyltransferase family 2 protein [bacterium]